MGRAGSVDGVALVPVSEGNTTFAFDREVHQYVVMVTTMVMMMILV